MTFNHPTSCTIVPNFVSVVVNPRRNRRDALRSQGVEYGKFQLFYIVHLCATHCARCG